MEREKAKIATPQVDIERYLKDSVFIEPTTLEEEFVRIPSDLAFWGQEYANAVKRYLIADMDFDRVQAETRILVRERLNVENAPPEDPDPKTKKLPRARAVTESMVDAAVEMDDSYHAARLAVIEAEAEKVRVAGIVEAVKAKRDMLISLGATQRAELRGDPMLRDDARARREG